MFHFKRFSIDDSQTAMKIGTDSVLLGAWAPVEGANNVLDVGTGSGVLALMVAQRNANALIDAVEIDAEAASLAESNFQMSPWHSRLKIICDSFQHFSQVNSGYYDLIISNPPFFSNSLQSPIVRRNLARHDDELPPADLFGGISKLLLPHGKVAMIFPENSLDRLTAIFQNAGLFTNEITYVKSKASSEAHRVMAVFSMIKSEQFIENELIIYSGNRIYTEEYKNLTREFYLNF